MSDDENKILKSLPLAEYSKLLPYLETVDLKPGEIIQQAGFSVEHVYFPRTALFTGRTMFRNGSGIESGVIGAEGIIGADHWRQPDNAIRQVLALTPGTCLRIKANYFRRLCHNLTSLREFVQNYLQAFNEQAVQLGACNSCHPLQMRLARMLLLCSIDNYISLTQETAADLLGAHRPSVTRQAHYFKNKSLITYCRGRMLITDRQGLEAEACECYESIKQVYSTYYAELSVGRSSQQSRSDADVVFDYRTTRLPAKVSAGKITGLS